MKIEPHFDPHPISQFLNWYETAEKADIRQPEAMTLATATRNGTPSARIVLYKGLNQKGFKFFTNYQSRKSRELTANPKAALVFYWPSLNRQIRIEGKVQKLTRFESDEYWMSRPRESRIGAIASKQSSVIRNRDVLEKKIAELSVKYSEKDIPRPKNWGGYCLIPNRFEFWLLGDYRLHDRFLYQKRGKKWAFYRLAP